MRTNYVYPIITIGHLPNLKTIKITSELWKHYYYEDGYGIVNCYHMLCGPSSVLEYIYIDGVCHDFHSSIALDKCLEETYLYKKAKEQKERQEEKKRLEEEQRAKWKKEQRCQYCGSHFKGLFFQSSPNCGKNRDY